MAVPTRFIVSIFVFMIFAGSAPVNAAEPMKFMVVGKSIPKSLTGKPGNAKKGRKAAIARRQGNCLACHAMPVPEQPDHGLVGPSLKGIASRYKEGELRLRLVDSKKINPATIMPAYYRTKGLHRVQKKWKGKTILKAQQIEDILAYLMTLK
jgi:sulfur-oxidizing protein SoxX